MSIPANVFELKPHQETAMLKMHNGCILCGGVGVGKSHTAVGYYLEREAPRPVYVITTAKKRDKMDWQTIFADVGMTRDPDTTMGAVVIVDSWNNIGKYEEVEDAFFIFDEQRLVGTGAWVKTFYKIAKANHWVMLSATPGDNWLDYVPVFRANGFIKNITQFKADHVSMVWAGTHYKIVGYRQVGKLVRWRNQLLVDMPYVRHTERVPVDVHVEYDQELIRKLVKERWHVYENRPLTDASELFRVMRKVVYTDESRLRAVEQLLKTHPRLIVFYNFDYELEILRTFSSSRSLPMKSSSTIIESPRTSGRATTAERLSISMEDGEQGHTVASYAAPGKETLSNPDTQRLMTSRTADSPSNQPQTEILRTLTSTKFDSSEKRRHSIEQDETFSENPRYYHPNLGSLKMRSKSSSESSSQSGSGSSLISSSTNDTASSGTETTSSSSQEGSEVCAHQKKSNGTLTETCRCTPEISSNSPTTGGSVENSLSKNQSKSVQSSTAGMTIEKSLQNTSIDGSISTSTIESLDPTALNAESIDLSKKSENSQKESRSSSNQPEDGLRETQRTLRATQQNTDGQKSGYEQSSEKRSTDPTHSTSTTMKLDTDLQQGAKAATFEVAEWNGHKHQPIPKTDSWVYLVQYVAGAEAWECTETDAMVFYSMPYSYKNWHQAHGRIDRLNTSFLKLYYYRLVSEAVIEKAVGLSLKAKKSFNEAAFGEMTGLWQN